MNFKQFLPNSQRKYTDATMKSWTKDQLIKHIRMCENNIAALAERVENQAKLLKETTHVNSASKVQSTWRTIGNISGFVACDKCGYWCGTKSKYCPDCGAEMDGEEHNNNV